MSRKREHLNIVVLRRDKEALRRLADAEGEAMSVVMRRLIREAAQKLDAQIRRQSGEGG